jgi:5'(3')-deoxyribonucleotidase
VVRMLAVDVDGVLADFDRKVRDILGLPPKEYIAQNSIKDFWRNLARYTDPDTGHGFYRSLPLMEDAMELWSAIEHKKPFLLTGCPMGQWAPPQKHEWAAEHFPAARVVTCMARDKRNYIEGPGHILIDDQMKNAEPWVEAGGDFIFHTSARESIKQLRELRPAWFA